MASYSSDTLPTCIEYHSADLYYTYTMYNPADIRWDVLNDIMSLYYLHIYHIFGLKGLGESSSVGRFGIVGLIRQPVHYFTQGIYASTVAKGFNTLNTTFRVNWSFRVN